jgi:tetratricopeptide (TPR) repeat protein
MAWVLNFSCILKRTLGAYVEAQTCLRKCLSLSESVDDRVIYGMALSQLGLVTQALGDNAQAIDLLNKSVPFLRELGEFWSLLHALIGLGVATLSI